MSRKVRPIRVEGNIAFVPLTKGYEAIIDAEDAVLVGQWNWGAQVAYRPDASVRTVYAVRTDRSGGTKRMVRMHRVIAETAGHLHTDHVSGDGLDNRRVNLRVATNVQNSQNQRIRTGNTSGVKGVTWHKRDRKWRAQITLHGKIKHLGLFTEMAKATAAYARASAELHGEFGRTE